MVVVIRIIYGTTRASDDLQAIVYCPNVVPEGHFTNCKNLAKSLNRKFQKWLLAVFLCSRCPQVFSL
jgi:hypothetical protein